MRHSRFVLLITRDECQLAAGAALYQVRFFSYPLVPPHQIMSVLRCGEGSARPVDFRLVTRVSTLQLAKIALLLLVLRELAGLESSGLLGSPVALTLRDNIKIRDNVPSCCPTS